jgi:hypothetical protein
MEEVKKEEPKDNFLETVAKAEKLKEELAALNAKHEQLISKQIMGGRTEAGIPPKEPVEETPQEYAKRILRGDKRE